MADAVQFGRESRAPFAFGGSMVELTRAVPLADGEQVMVHGVGRSRTSWRLSRPVLLRLSAPRLVALSHYAFAPDRILVLPRGAICDTAVRGDEVHVVWQRAAAVTATLRIGPWTGPSRLDHPLPMPAELEHVLNQWRLTG